MITVRSGQAGGLIYLVDAPPSTLPLVTKRDLEQAWEAAAAVRQPGSPRRFVFTASGAEPVELAVNDPDATAWVAAVEQTIGLATPRGISVCLRLLALVAIMAQAGWVRRFFTLGPADAQLRPELLQAAALLPLNQSGGFDETALRALLP